LKTDYPVFKEKLTISNSLRVLLQVRSNITKYQKIVSAYLMDYLLCVNPDKIGFSIFCYRVINNLYLIVLSNLINTKKTTAFKYNLF